MDLGDQADLCFLLLLWDLWFLVVLLAQVLHLHLGGLVDQEILEDLAAP